MNQVFADTFYWVALLHRKDASHRAVLEFSRTLVSAVLVTTDEVLTEVLAFCSLNERMRREAALTVRDVLTGRNVRVIPQSRHSFLDGLALYEARPDKGYSLTDCVSMQTMRREATRSRMTGISSRKASAYCFGLRFRLGSERGRSRPPAPDDAEYHPADS